MPDELELKAVVADPAAVRERLLAAGAHPGFKGLMEDRRYDRDGQLLRRDEVLRVRRFRPDGPAPGGGGEPQAEVSWKGPTRRSPEGYKVREETVCRMAAGSGEPERLLRALGYAPSHAIDRYVELYELDGAVVRLEWYPRMDVLIEVEGAPAAIEWAIRATGIPRGEFTAEPLVEFVRRYEPRTGRPAALSLAELGGERPSWELPSGEPPSLRRTGRELR